jgi:hypothetical protein
MEFKEASEKYNIPLKALYVLHKKGVLPLRLQNEHLERLELLYLTGNMCLIPYCNC